MKEADLAICIPTYNQCKFLPRAVRSALNQNVRAKVIAIGDDASTDETPQAMMDLLNTEPMLEYHRNEVNLGIAGNNSKLMSLTKSEFVVRLDSDDLLEPQYIQTLLPLMQAHPTAGYGHAAILQIDQNDEPIRHVHMNRRTGFQGPDEALKESIKSYRVAANIVIYRRQALEQVKYFKSRPDYCEDYDMSARLAAAGWGNVYSDEVLARYRIWTDNAGLRPRRKQQQLAGYCRIFDEVFQPGSGPTSPCVANAATWRWSIPTSVFFLRTRPKKRSDSSHCFASLEALGRSNSNCSYYNSASPPFSSVATTREAARN